MKRTLVISNACFSDEGSNGRTLKNLFNGAEPEKLAQFFLYGKPDFSVCHRYYQVSDKTALESIISLKTKGGPIEVQDEESLVKKDTMVNKAVNKNPIKLLIREIVWLVGRWKTPRFWEWVESFQPQIICLYIANNIFLIRLARQIAHKYNIPIIVYSTEGYSFMNFNYLTNRKSIVYDIYYACLCREYRKVAKYTREGFFNNTLLCDKYQLTYGYPCQCVMNSSKIEYFPKVKVDFSSGCKISYLGNLGLGRYKALMEIAQELQEIDKTLYLDIYGAAPNDDISRELSECLGIQFHGFVPYSKVVEIIHESSLLIHAELNEKLINRDLCYAFSTKIADCICSGTPLLFYANEKLAETIFLKENQCAFIVHDRTDLKAVLIQALNDEEQRRKVLENAKKTRDKYLTGNYKFIEALM